MAMDEIDVDGHDDQTSVASDKEEDTWEAHWDEHGYYVCLEEDCEHSD